MFRVFLSLVFLFVAVAAHAQTPSQVVKGYVDSIISVLKDKRLSPEEKKKKIERIMDGAIYWDRVGRMVLGIHARRLPKKKVEEFTQVFRRFVAKVYAKKFVKYSTGNDLDKIKVAYKREIRGEDTATVLMDLTTAEGKVVPISCKLVRVGDRWLIYDVYVEGISMVNNYRVQVNRVINKRGFEHLMKVLRRKVG